MFSTKCAIMSINKKDIIHFMPLQMVHSLELDVEGKLEFALSTFVQFLIILSIDSLLCYKQPVTNCRLVCSYIFLHYIFHSTVICTSTCTIFASFVFFLARFKFLWK